MHSCFFVSDLHGKLDRYEKLFAAILAQRPRMVFLGGDLLPSFGRFSNEFGEDFLSDYVQRKLKNIRDSLKDDYPRIFFIFGNDDPAIELEAAQELEKDGLWMHAHNRSFDTGLFRVLGYAFVPPTPFRLKDWERYDVSRFVDPGCIAPSEGSHTIAVPESTLKYATIQQDLEAMDPGGDLSHTIFLFHTPPYRTNLDRAALDGKKIDHVPLDVNVGSIAVRRFIEKRQPLMTMHGHIHESARLTGHWRDRLGKTFLFTGAHDGSELALVQFDPNDPDGATRELI